MAPIRSEITYNAIFGAKNATRTLTLVLPSFLGPWQADSDLFHVCPQRSIAVFNRELIYERRRG